MFLEVENLQAGYGTEEVLHGVSLRVDEGEIVSILGANGAGKTTTLLTISGLVRASGGAVRFQGEDLHTLPSHEVVRRGLTQSPEGRRVFGVLTVLENLRLGAFTVGDKEKAEQTLDWIFDLFPRLHERKDQLAGTLSGGEQQRVGLARALVNNPKIIIADEPTGNVDPDLSFEIVDLLSEINRRGTTVLMVTHEHDLVQHFHKRVIEIHGGVVVADTNVKNQPQPYVRGASVPNTPEQEQDTFQDDDLLDDDYREDDAGEQVTYPDSDYQEMLRRYSVASEEELEEQTEEVKEYIPGHVKEHIVNVETISQPEAQSEDEDNEEEIVHYEDALEELENVLKHETEEDEKDKEVAKG